MSDEDATAAARLVRVLEVLAVAGGAALVERDSDELSVVAGEVDDGLLARARFLSMPGVGEVVRSGDALVAAVGVNYTLVVRVPPGLTDAAFSGRVRRCAALLGRYVFMREASGPTGPSTPPSANAALFARVPRRRA